MVWKARPPVHASMPQLLLARKGVQPLLKARSGKIFSVIFALKLPARPGEW